MGLSSHSLWPVGLGLKQLTAWNLNIRGNQKARVPDLSEVLKVQAEVCGGGGGGSMQSRSQEETMRRLQKQGLESKNITDCLKILPQKIYRRIK